jgi:hypothetical protein
VKVLTSLQDRSILDTSCNKREGDMSSIKCPYCKAPLDKKPKRKKKCPDCGNYIFVKKGRLLTEDQKVAEEWRDRLAHFGVTTQTFVQHYQPLAAQFGKPPSVNDIVWSILNDLVVKAGWRQDRQDLRVLYSEMARLVSMEGKSPKPFLAEVAKQTLLEIQDTGFTHVKVYTANDELVCPACRKLQDKIFSIEQALADMPIPNVCENDEDGCRCGYVVYWDG